MPNLESQLNSERCLNLPAKFVCDMLRLIKMRFPLVRAAGSVT